MLSNKEKEILEMLKKNTGNIVTSKAIANNLKLSDRTVRSYIKRLQKILLENGAEIIAKSGQGYMFKINQEFKFNTFLQQYKNNLINKQNFIINDQKDREYYILKKLLIENKYILIDDLCEELFICRSTLSNDFLQIKKNLSLYNLSIKYKVKKGLYVEGDEKEKRNFIISYFFESNLSNSINKYVDNTLFSNNINLDKIMEIILNECRKEDFKLSDYVIQNLILYFALMVNRIKNGFTLTSIEVDKSIENKKEFIVAYNILKCISEINDIKFSKEEIYYIALNLKSKNSSEFVNNNFDFTDKEKIRRELINILDEIENDTGYFIKDDQQFINSFLVHFYKLRMRLKNGIKLENPLLNEIKETHMKTFSKTKNYFSNMPILKGYNISDSEWAYIYLHFMAAIERCKDNKKFNVLVICATGYGSSQMLSIRLKKEFGKHINIVDIIGYYEITDQKLEGIDFIISSIDLYSIVFNIPIINVSVFLNDFEVNKIKLFIESNMLRRFEENENSKRKLLSEKIRLFEEFFFEECFITLNKVDSKQNIINALLTLLQKREDECYYDVMINQIKQRERMSCVVFSEDIAVPHPAKSVGKKTQVAVAIVKQGVRWDDRFKNIKYIFLVSPSKTENYDLIKITEAIVSLIENDKIKNKLLKCNNFNEFKEVFIELI